MISENEVTGLLQTSLMRFQAAHAKAPQMTVASMFLLTSCHVLHVTLLGFGNIPLTQCARAKEDSATNRMYVFAFRCSTPEVIFVCMLLDSTPCNSALWCLWLHEETQTCILMNMLPFFPTTCKVHWTCASNILSQACSAWYLFPDWVCDRQFILVCLLSGSLC